MVGLHLILLVNEIIQQLFVIEIVANVVWIAYAYVDYVTWIYFGLIVSLNYIAKNSEILNASVKKYLTFISINLEENCSICYLTSTSNDISFSRFKYMSKRSDSGVYVIHYTHFVIIYLINKNTFNWQFGNDLIIVVALRLKKLTVICSWCNNFSGMMRNHSYNLVYSISFNYILKEILIPDPLIQIWTQ